MRKCSAELMECSEKVPGFKGTEKSSETDDFPYLLRLNFNARIMLTTNVEIDDWLINGQIRRTADFKFKEQKVITIHVQLDGQKAA